MISHEESVSRDDITENQLKIAQRNWFKSLILGILTVFVSLLITFSISSDQDSSIIIIPIGIIISTFLGTMVFLIGTFISSK